ncbi:hypothetical protein SUNI508_08081 [Seiridium unicorne]|uniref:Uncharacterized protein n=1 Tax=Seiridium unicorne TaxID=138068 RepID=A0ABR2UUL6_9PEZI
MKFTAWASETDLVCQDPELVEVLVQDVGRRASATEYTDLAAGVVVEKMEKYS